MYFKRLRDLREDHDMKQSEVAEYLGIQQTVYSRYERGFQSIPVEHLIKLADFPQITFSAENSYKLKIKVGNPMNAPTVGLHHRQLQFYARVIYPSHL